MGLVEVVVSVLGAGGLLAWARFWLIERKKVSLDERKLESDEKQSFSEILLEDVKGLREVNQGLQDKVVELQDRVTELTMRCSELENLYKMVLERFDKKKLCARADCPNRIEPI